MRGSSGVRSSSAWPKLRQAAASTGAISGQVATMRARCSAAGGSLRMPRYIAAKARRVQRPPRAPRAKKRAIAAGEQPLLQSVRHQAARVAGDDRPHAIGVGRGDPQGGGAADRVAEQHDALEAERIERRRPAARRSGRRSAARVGGRATLIRPVERDHPVAVAMPGAEAGEVAGTVADGVEADDRRSPALVVVRQADAVDGDRASIRRGPPRRESKATRSTGFDESSIDWGRPRQLPILLVIDILIESRLAEVGPKRLWLGRLACSAVRRTEWVGGAALRCGRGRAAALRRALGDAGEPPALPASRTHGGARRVLP